jgi:hypothetical protein
LLLLHLFLLLLLPLLLLLLQGDAPVVWRGPIVNNAIDRFLMGTSWGDLNVLVVDMPPGNVQRARGGGRWLPTCHAVHYSYDATLFNRSTIDGKWT